jgi:hypothetical protein
MDTETIKKVELAIQNLTNKTSRIYFLVQDTKGNPKGGVRYIYQMAHSLLKQGFNSIILHETKDYKGVGEWMGEEYMNIPHTPIEGQELKIAPEDFVIIPELYGHVLEQLSNISSGKIILCQAYDHMLETLPPGANWAQFGFLKCITTSKEQKEYIESVQRGISFDIVEPLIPSLFDKKDKPAKPIISIQCREPRDTAKIVKTFYLKYPQFRWITFRDIRGVSQSELSTVLKESFVSVWVDQESGFGTYPIESMASGTPVIGKVPNLKPEWMNDNNGIWTFDFNQIVDVLAEFIQNWLEDNISDKLYTAGFETSMKYQNEELFNTQVKNIFEDFLQNRKESFSEQLEKLKIEETN